MERRSGLWVASTPDRPWEIQGRPGTTRRSDVGLEFDGMLDQRWDGVGGYFSEAGWAALSALRMTDREKVIQALFERDEGCRFNLCSLPMGASDCALAWYSCNEADGDLGMRHFTIARDRHHLLPYVRLALRYQPRLRLSACPWSPPAWMKTSGTPDSGRIIWKPEVLESYALYFTRFVQAYRREGIVIHKVQVQNEPAAGRGVASCLWSGAELRDFIRNHLGPMFGKQGVRAEIWLGPLDTDDYSGYTLGALSDPLARQHIAGVAYQGPGKESVLRTHRSWPALRIMQTGGETGDGRNSWAQALRGFGLLQHYLTCGANAAVHRNMVLPCGAGLTGANQNSMVTVDPETRTFHLNPEYYMMKHYAHFIDRYAYRLGLTGEWSGNAVAFSNEDGSRVLVFNNPFPEPRRVVLKDGERLLTLNLLPESFNTLVL